MLKGHEDFKVVGFNPDDMDMTQFYEADNGYTVYGKEPITEDLEDITEDFNDDDDHDDDGGITEDSNDDDGGDTSSGLERIFSGYDDVEEVIILDHTEDSSEKLMINHQS